MACSFFVLTQKTNQKKSRLYFYFNAPKATKNLNPTELVSVLNHKKQQFIKNYIDKIINEQPKTWDKIVAFGTNNTKQSKRLN